MRRSSYRTVAFVLASAIAEALGGQSPRGRIVVGDNINVSGIAHSHPLIEPHLTAHPSNAKHLLATAMAVKASSIADSDCAAFVSLDGGGTWSRHDFLVAGCADPWLALRDDGAAVFAGLSTADGNALHLGHSQDGGRTWVALPQALGRALDHETMIVDQTNGPRSGTIYLVAQGYQLTPGGRSSLAIVVARSIDGGRTFAPPVGVVPSNLNINVLTPGVLSDGSLVIPYMDFQSNVSDFRSRAGELERKRVWMITSTDGGQRFSHPSFVTEACGLGFGALAVDGSSRSTRDRIYYVCNNRELTGVLVHHSKDGGEKWSPPARADDGTAAAFRRPSSVAVNRDGVLAVTWTQRRLVGAQSCHDVYFTASLDGGATFLPSARVSATTSCPDTPGNDRVARRWPEGGDYSGLAAAADGSFHLLWADSRDGMFRLWTARVTVVTAAAQ